MPRAQPDAPPAPCDTQPLLDGNSENVNNGINGGTHSPYGSIDGSGDHRQHWWRTRHL